MRVITLIPLLAAAPNGDQGVGWVQVYHPIQSIESDYVVASGFGEFLRCSSRLKSGGVSPQRLS
jgi:hypothetical protein